MTRIVPVRIVSKTKHHQILQRLTPSWAYEWHPWTVRVRALIQYGPVLVPITLRQNSDKNQGRVHLRRFEARSLVQVHGTDPWTTPHRSESKDLFLTQAAPKRDRTPQFASDLLTEQTPLEHFTLEPS